MSTLPAARPPSLAAPGTFIAAARRRPLITAMLVAITILGAVLRFDAIGTSTRVSVDERSYLGIANNMVVHRSYAYGSDPRHWAPGAPFMFAAAMKLTGTAPTSNAPGGANPALYVQASVSTLAILAVFALAAWLGGAVAGLAAALATAIYDPLILVARSYLTEALGGLGLVLAVAAICVAISRTHHRARWALGAGVLLGLTVLTRNDMLLLFGVLPAVALVLVWRRETLPAAVRVAALLVASAVATIAPWVTYASLEEGRFTPITTAGPSSLWVATYLPAGGRQIIVKRQFMEEVCRTFPAAQDACGVTATQMDMRLIFKVLQRRHPGMSEDQAIQAELDRNIRDYALGQPVSFAQMLAGKAGRIWGRPWGGGAIGKQESSVWQHRLLLGVAVAGILAGLIAGGRRRRYIVLGASALLAVTALNTIFVSESRMSLRMTPLVFALGLGGIGAAARARREQEQPGIAADPAASAAGRSAGPVPASSAATPAGA